ncbi:hypothetical protein AB685_28380 [Bacillus sp. LL01]|uniref:hypothetical protein n=1 Tax=Bacillus sp. LL01 TaxID=1665556 RepID=UPI00064D21F4|nr:hypothetical protein [Bacillus sp. LL01]KMJ55218.1 hypothetical protein AB685_28380 [Bacillus sp. LL01]
MAVITLLEYISHNKFPVTLVNDHFTLNEIIIEHYEFTSNNQLWILSNDSHEITLNLSDFKNIQFDACISSATNSKEMIEIIRNLEKDTPYNAYLMNSNKKMIVGFYRIGNYN